MIKATQLVYVNDSMENEPTQYSTFDVNDVLASFAVLWA